MAKIAPTLAVPATGFISMSSFFGATGFYREAGKLSRSDKLHVVNKFRIRSRSSSAAPHPGVACQMYSRCAAALSCSALVRGSEVSQRVLVLGVSSDPLGAAARFRFGAIATEWNDVRRRRQVPGHEPSAVSRHEGPAINSSFFPALSRGQGPKPEGAERSEAPLTPVSTGIASPVAGPLPLLPG